MDQERECTPMKAFLSQLNTANVRTVLSARTIAMALDCADPEERELRMKMVFYEATKRHGRAEEEVNLRMNNVAEYCVRNPEELARLAGPPQYDTEGEQLRQLCASDRPGLIRAADVPYEPPRWLIAPYFQLGKGTLIQGDNGSGKTAFLCAVAAHVSSGQPLLGLPVETRGDVVFLSVEDDLGVLRGRIEACGGNLECCHFMTNPSGLTFLSPEVEAAIRDVRARLVVFDPFQAFLGSGVDMFRSNETRPALARLFEMCARNDCACAIIAHTGKQTEGKSLVNRSLGSVDIPAAMRSILQLERNPEDREECVMVHIKCSNAPRGRSIAYRIGSRGGVRWTGFSPLREEDITAARRRETEVPYEQEPLGKVLSHLAAGAPQGGFWTYEQVRREAEGLLGFQPFASTADLKRRFTAAFCGQLREREGLSAVCGARGNGNARGIRLSPAAPSRPAAGE